MLPKKFYGFVENKYNTWSEKKFSFVFIQLPILALCVYCLVITGFALWSFNKNMKVAQEFAKLEASYENLKQSYRERQRYQTQYQAQQLQQRYNGPTQAQPLPR